MRFKIFLLSLLTLLENSIYISLGEEITLEPLIVTSTRIESERNADRMPIRSQDSVVFDDKSASYFSVPSALNRLSMADARIRGPYGEQADISLRGAPFEQNLVLLGGVNLNDPKSGHHNMDLPLTAYDIDRIDITYGPASSVYGSGALGGAVNIVPKEPGDKFSASFSSAAGSWDFYSGGASFDMPLGPARNRTSIEWKRTTGFAAEREFDGLTASSYTKANFECAEFDVFLSYLTKKFGADSFYSDLYSNEEESVNTGLLIAKGKMKKDTVTVLPVFYFKRLQDKFILDRNRPEFSRNDHDTYLYGGEIASQVETPLGMVVTGAGVGAEEISSTNIGGHSRTKTNVFLEYENRISDFLLNTSARLDYYSTFGAEFSPSFAVGYEIAPNFTVRSGAGRSFRAPTFTDLYYSTVANKGNPDLTPESAWTYELGFDSAAPGAIMAGTIFLRNTEKAIDWTRQSPTSAWQAENIGEFDIYGLEGSFKLEFEKFMKKNFLKTAAFKYAYLEALDKKGITSKYVLEYLKHNVNLELECGLPFGFTEEFNFAFRKRIGSEGYFLFDSLLYKDLKFKEADINLFLKVDNIFNTEYSEQGDIKMPPRAVFAGTRMRF